jgi:TyrR family helix-turn-helix protein
MYNRTYGLKKRFSPQALKVLLSYQYPGNIRELKNIINSAVLMSETDVLEKSIVNAILELKLEKDTLAIEYDEESQSLKNQLSSVEKTILAKAFSKYRSTREVARRLNLSQSSVVRKMKHHGIVSE